MQAAYLEDLDLIKNNQPATKKLLLVKDVVNMASKKQFQKPLMDNGFLSQLRNWLLPLKDGSLPSSILRDNLYTFLQTVILLLLCIEFNLFSSCLLNSQMSR